MLGKTLLSVIARLLTLREIKSVPFLSLLIGKVRLRYK